MTGAAPRRKPPREAPGSTGLLGQLKLSFLMVLATLCIAAIGIPLMDLVGLESRVDEVPEQPDASPADPAPEAAPLEPEPEPPTTEADR